MNTNHSWLLWNRTIVSEERNAIFEMLAREPRRAIFPNSSRAELWQILKIEPRAEPSRRKKWRAEPSSRAFCRLVLPLLGRRPSDDKQSYEGLLEFTIWRQKLKTYSALVPEMDLNTNFNFQSQNWYFWIAHDQMNSKQPKKGGVIGPPE